MIQRCKVTGEQFELSDSDLRFYRERDVPLPSLSPLERMRRRMAFRHGTALHHVTCGLTGKKIISMYAPSSRFVVFEQNAWWSDSWSGFSYGRDFDFNQAFFPQFAKLFNDVPHISLVNTNSENSYYTNHGLNLKNCYLLFGATNDEDCLYGNFILSCKDVIDSTSVVSSELCYDGVASFECYDCISFTNSKNCNNCVLIEDCQSCESCIACFGLRGKKYHILNHPVTKEAFLKIKAELQTARYAQLATWHKHFEELKSSISRVYAHLYNCENCTGDMLFNCKDCESCFDLRNSEHCKYIAFSPNSSHSHDCNFTAPEGVQFSYECVSTLAKDSKFNAMVWHGNEIDYSMECHHSQNLFGCVGLKKAQYCIFNKQYTKNEYDSLRKRIIAKMKDTGEWGEFFPHTLSPYAYNDSIAHKYFPLKESEVLARGYNWRDDIANDPTAIKSVPITIDQSEEIILTADFQCATTGKKFKITPSELRFYKKMHLPIPKYAPEERLRQRFARRAPYRLFEQKCAQCEVKLSSVYAKPEKVLCQKDFLASES